MLQLKVFEQNKVVRKYKINLDIQNTYLLSKWLFKLCNEKGIGQELLRSRMGAKDKFLSFDIFRLKMVHK